MPERVQLCRTKGWQMPANTVKVDRTTKWGNPFTIAEIKASGVGGTMDLLRGVCVSKFRNALRHNLPFTCEDVQRDLAGKNLACWCPLGSPCHADVLLEVANSGGAR
jgi:hypothetical protein